MQSMASPPVMEARTPLPRRPAPHERDGRQPAPDAGARPHPQHRLAVTAIVDREVGPRRPGAIYQNVGGRFEVLALVTNPNEAAALLRRDSARWAVIVRDTLRPDGQPFAVGSVWTTSDHLIRSAPAGAPGRAGYGPAA
ncbi:hypothetical protein [Streptomyces flavofungini]|uniref:hypothetical protein n=1 Tax=Streptomyces flavofungini TaxID=68200 RepID=UPI0025B1EABE|nr:hypothetical protein [Streptomyces flavofungini]WJV51774.1 hypothetical protein QUY26_39800 [Streptomyces flavofungini]